MAIGKDMALAGLGTLQEFGAFGGLTDGQLLERFGAGWGADASTAFEVLVARHGPMVLRVCSSCLDDSHDVQDAFQATFLILLKKARGLWVRDSLGPWLHQVAVRTARCARANALRRRKLERAFADRSAATSAAVDGPYGSDLEAALHAEIDRLPERYRAPIVLCDLEGLTCEEAAHRMGRPIGTVKSWRSRGRDRLRSRLLKRGFAPAAFPVLAIHGGAARAATALANSLASEWTSGKVSASVQGLVQGALKSMLVLKLNAAVAPALVLTFVSTGLAAAWGFDREAGPAGDVKGNGPAAVAPKPAPVATTPPAAADVEPPAVQWPLTLREAIRIGLERSDRIDSIDVEGPETIVRPCRGEDPLLFKAHSELYVRGIESKYWSLLAHRWTAEAWESASALGRELKTREVARVAAGERKLEDLEQTIRVLDRLKADAAAARQSTTAAEQALRGILNMPEADDRRIVPTTIPRTSKRTVAWEAALQDMNRNHPTILQAVAVAGEPARNQAVHETVHTLSRFFLEQDVNQKQLQDATQRREAASAASKARCVAYEEGRATGVEYGEAIVQAAEAAALEMQYLAAFNTSIANLEEAKGTLLDCEGVRILDAKGDAPQGVSTVASANPPTPKPAPNPPIEVRPSVSPDRRAEPVAIAPEAPRGATYSFHLSFGVGPNPYEIRGSFTVPPPAPAASR